MKSSGEYPDRVVKVVLTVAHLNHVAGDDRPENLAALCNCCHLRYDREQHAISARETRNRKRGIIEILAEPEVKP